MSCRVSSIPSLAENPWRSFGVYRGRWPSGGRFRGPGEEALLPWSNVGAGAGAGEGDDVDASGGVGAGAGLSIVSGNRRVRVRIFLVPPVRHVQRHGGERLEGPFPLIERRVMDAFPLPRVFHGDPCLRRRFACGGGFRFEGSFVCPVAGFAQTSYYLFGAAGLQETMRD